MLACSPRRPRASPVLPCSVPMSKNRMDRRGGWPLHHEDLPYLWLRTGLAVISIVSLATGHFLLGGTLFLVAIVCLRRYRWDEAVLDPPLAETLKDIRK